MAGPPSWNINVSSSCVNDKTVMENKAVSAEDLSSAMSVRTIIECSKSKFRILDILEYLLMCC